MLDSVPQGGDSQRATALGSQYAQGGRGITVEEVAGGYQLRTRKEFAPHIRKLLAAKPPRLSRPLLETLAIIAYRQPITRPEIEQLRGVDRGGVLETLLERRLVKIAGRKDAPGRPMVYETTHEFLEVFGLKDFDSLPDLSEFQEIERAVAGNRAWKHRDRRDPRRAPRPRDAASDAPRNRRARSDDDRPALTIGIRRAESSHRDCKTPMEYDWIAQSPCRRRRRSPGV